MSQLFAENGDVVPVTLVEALPNTVLLRRTTAKDGYQAIQLGLPKHLENDDPATMSPSQLVRTFRARREVAIDEHDDVQQLSVEQFTVGDVVEVSGISKGKGFQGVVKRHHFKGGPASHGHTDWERKSGSIGQRFPQHVMKGKRMPGRMGADRVTVKNLMVAAIDADKHLLAIKGAIPGKYGSVVEIRFTSSAGK